MLKSFSIGRTRRFTFGRLENLIYPIEAAQDAFEVVVLSKRLGREILLDGPHQARLHEELGEALSRFELREE